VRIPAYQSSLQFIELGCWYPLENSSAHTGSDVNNKPTFAHHLHNPPPIEGKRLGFSTGKGFLPHGFRDEVLNRQVSFSFCIRFHSLCHVLTNHHRFQLAAGLPCALSAELLACFVGSCPRRLARPACRHKRCISRPLAADRQQATQRVQACKETLALASSRVAYSIPSSRVRRQPILPTSKHYPCQRYLARTAIT
jgi:hypothetical protein